MKFPWLAFYLFLFYKQTVFFKSKTSICANSNIHFIKFFLQINARIFYTSHGQTAACVAFWMACLISWGKYLLKYTPGFKENSFNKIFIHKSWKYSILSSIYGLYSYWIHWFFKYSFFTFNYSVMAAASVNHIDIRDNIIPRLQFFIEKIFLIML